MVENKKISFIVPIYNVKDYLRKCVDSLLAQDYEDYEIILVDDGSTDGSGAMADAIAEKWELRTENREPEVSVRVIHQENRGLSGARNAGIEIAQGEYICFVDSDDYWEENVLEGLMAQTERDQLDVLRFNFRNVNENGDVELPNQTTDPHVFNDYSELVTDGKRFLEERMGVNCYACQFIVKRVLLVSNDNVNDNDNKCCLFTEGMLFEDTEWTPRMLMKAKRVASTETMVYNYLTRVGSITKAVSKEKRQKILNDKMRLIEMLQGYSGRWFEGMVAATVLGVMEVLASDFYEDRVEYIDKLNEMHVFPLSTYHIWPKALKKIRLINMSPRVALFILHTK